MAFLVISVPSVDLLSTGLTKAHIFYFFCM